MKNNHTQSKTPREGRPDGGEVYPAPPPPSKGRIIGIDCHPDIFTAAVFEGSTPHAARLLRCRADLSLEGLLAWAAADFGKDDLFLMEAGSNSFEIHRRLAALGLRAAVLESAHVGRHAKTYADNDKLAAARIVRVYLAGNCPAVWVPDATTCQRRELLHAHRKAVADHTAATNSLKGYLNQSAVRLGSRNPASAATRAWIVRQREWSPMQRELLEHSFGAIDHAAAARQRLTRLIGVEAAKDPLMLRCMKLLGIGMVNAFALLAVIGDVRRFNSAAKLVAYLGLNPGQRISGRGKHIRLGVGRRGRGDMRHLLVQGAHAVLRMGRHSALGQWGMKLLLRKGNRNVAVAAIARKLAVQVWHLLSDHPPQMLETDKSLRTKLGKLCVTLGKNLRAQLAFPPTIAGTVDLLCQRISSPQQTSPI